MTKKDLFVLGIAFVLGGLIVGVLVYLNTKETIIVHQPDEAKFKRTEDSLIHLIKLDRDTIGVYKKNVAYTDSLISNNLKTLNDAKKLTKSFTYNSRKRHLDSLFKSAGL